MRKLRGSAWGGTETHLFSILPALAARGVSGEVHAPVDSDPTPLPASDAPVQRYRGHLPFVGSRARRAALLATGGNILSFDLPWRLARSPVSLAHLHTGRRIGGAARIAMRATARPYVVSLHGPVFADEAFLTRETARRGARLVDLGAPYGVLVGARRVLTDAARVLTFNDGEHAAAAERFGARAVRMDHGVDGARFAAGCRARARQRWPALGDAPVAVVVGRLAEQKNQGLALAAFARGAPLDAQLVLAGAETDRGYRARLEDEARALGIAARVHWLGNVAPEVVPDLLARAEVVLVPSVQEAFGLAVLEGWAAGRPVLFAARSGLRDLARAHGEDATACADLEVETWAAKLAALFAAPGLREAVVRRGAALVAERFSWATVAQRLAALYEDVLAGGAA